MSYLPGVWTCERVYTHQLRFTPSLILQQDPSTLSPTTGLLDRPHIANKNSESAEQFWSQIEDYEGSLKHMSEWMHVFFLLTIMLMRGRETVAHQVGGACDVMASDATLL